MAWEIELGPIEDWLRSQDIGTQVGIYAALEILEREGPALGRPLVDSLVGSRIHNLKELRPAAGQDAEVRILFAFDSKRRAVLLVAGDKSRGKRGRIRWSGWYRRAIPEAERRYKEYLANAKGKR